jgi:hypothetical protein
LSPCFSSSPPASLCVAIAQRFDSVDETQKLFYVFDSHEKFPTVNHFDLNLPASSSHYANLQVVKDISMP